MIKPELVKKIREYFNLNIYETKVWLALISKGVASAGEIAELSGVPRSRTYDVLESLEKEGFAIAKVGKPSKFIAVKPVAVLEKIKHNLHSKTEEKIKTLESLKGTKEYSELETLHSSSLNQVKSEELSGSLKGRSNILSHAREILENAEKEIVICMPALELMDKSRLFSGLFEKLRKGNINVKVSLKGTDEDVKKVSEKLGIKAIRTDVDSKFFIIDKKQTLLYLNNTENDEDDLAVWLNSDFFSNSLASLYESTRR
jgi:sugar-specific transcriptional regulator TrmB